MLFNVQSHIEQLVENWIAVLFKVHIYGNTAFDGGRGSNASNTGMKMYPVTVHVFLCVFFRCFFLQFSCLFLKSSQAYV